jgi:4Fe-4S single cluster domain of Ferredoxin I
MTITEQQSHLAFHLTGAVAGGALRAIDESALLPALLARYRDLTNLRYDYPLVLLEHGAEQPFASLSSIIDELVSQSAGDDEARTRKQLLQLEREMRSMVAAGDTGTLSTIWDRAATRLAPSSDDPLACALGRARSNLARDGQLLDCDRALPAMLMVRAWRFCEDLRAREMLAEIERYKFRLWEILRADFMRSGGGREPAVLQASVGKSFEGVFDFKALSSTLAKAGGPGGLSPSRRQRIESVLSVLAGQRFFATPARAADAYPFMFSSCTDVEVAWRERLPKVRELAKALAIAQLEVKGEYNELRHDALFATYGERGLPRDELARFPSYLVCLQSTAFDDCAHLMTLLGADVPVKALVQFDDLLEDGAQLKPYVALSMRSKQLADMAIGLGSVYVLQSAASNLVRARSRIVSGLRCDGPALFSIYSGASAHASVAPYLRSAAAMEARVFPAFSYDPAAGATWAERFIVTDNPQPERDWPVQSLSYENGEHQRASEDIDFTLIDFAALDERCAPHFAAVPAAECNGHLAPVRAWLQRDGTPPVDSVPFITMVDENNVLQRVVVDASVVEEARRCRTAWQSLQELGGINNSHAQRLLARERVMWEEQNLREQPVAKSQAAAVTDAAEQTAAAKADAAHAAPGQEEKASDDPYIETPRCTTCEECVQINNKMFVYDGNKQAYIADVNAGTYRQLVEAAESCQVSIIHPGKPRNADEPGLAELIERAQAFA